MAALVKERPSVEAGSHGVSRIDTDGSTSVLVLPLSVESALLHPLAAEALLIAFGVDPKRRPTTAD